MALDGITTQQLQQTLKKTELERSTLASKVQELKAEQLEHALVLDAFKDVEPTRRCFRLVGGVLVERTVADIQPGIAQNAEKLETFVKQLSEQLEVKSKMEAVLTTTLKQRRGQ